MTDRIDRIEYGPYGIPTEIKNTPSDKEYPYDLTNGKNPFGLCLTADEANCFRERLRETTNKKRPNSKF
jgi:hypothetical protein